MIDYSLPVQWQEGDRHHVGKVAIVRHGAALTGHVREWIETRDGFGFRTEVERILIRHSHTGELEFVARERLSQYGEGIESP